MIGCAPHRFGKQPGPVALRRRSTALITTREHLKEHYSSADSAVTSQSISFALKVSLARGKAWHGVRLFVILTL